jgi:hypothetical protein
MGRGTRQQQPVLDNDGIRSLVQGQDSGCEPIWLSDAQLVPLLKAGISAENLDEAANLLWHKRQTFRDNADQRYAELANLAAEFLNEQGMELDCACMRVVQSAAGISENHPAHLAIGELRALIDDSLVEHLFNKMAVRCAGTISRLTNRSGSALEDVLQEDYDVATNCLATDITSKRSRLTASPGLAG